MFYVIYEFTVDAAVSSEFEKLWHDLTIEIRNNSGGLGSRLHKALNKPNSWVAYAQWPDKKTWENAAPLNVTSQASVRKRMREVCSDIEVVYQLEMTDDLLVEIPRMSNQKKA
jgi:quinol monooxygenase YgiN